MKYWGANSPHVVIVPMAACLGNYLDDAQAERVVVQKFEPGNVFGLSNASMTIVDAITGPKPVLYVRVSNNPLEELT